MQTKFFKNPASRRHFLAHILLGILMLSAVAFISIRSDLAGAQRMLATNANYIKEQCNRYARIELASETKSLMRVMESGSQIFVFNSFRLFHVISRFIGYPISSSVGDMFTLAVP